MFCYVICVVVAETHAEVLSINSQIGVTFFGSLGLVLFAFINSVQNGSLAEKEVHEGTQWM